MIERRRLLQAFAGSLALESTLPVWGLGNQPRPLRVALVETGSYYRNDILFRLLIEELSKVGVLPKISLPPPLADYSLRAIWKTLSKFPVKGKLNFLVDGFYSCGYSDKTAKENAQKIRKRIDTHHDIDLILTLGIAGTEETVKAIHDIPVIVLDDLPNPRKSELLNPDGRLVQNNVHVRIEKNCFSDQIRLFRQHFDFRRLGHLGLHVQRKSINEDEIRDTCRELGVAFDCRFHTFSDDKGEPTVPDAQFWYEWFFDETRKMVLQDGVDALYLPYFPATDQEFQDFLRFLCKHRIPAFAGTGYEPVRRGILMGVGKQSIHDIARYEANVLTRLIAGDAPDAIPTAYFCRTSLVLNLRTAAWMGWKSTFKALHTVEQVYTTHSPIASATLY